MRLLLCVTGWSAIAMAAAAQPAALQNQIAPVAKAAQGSHLSVAVDPNTAAIGALEKRIDQMEKIITVLRTENDLLRTSKADKAQVDTLRNDFDHHFHIYKDWNTYNWTGTSVPGMYCKIVGKEGPSCSMNMSGMAK